MNIYLYKMELEFTQPSSFLKCCNARNNFDYWSPITDHQIVQIWIYLILESEDSWNKIYTEIQG